MKKKFLNCLVAVLGAMLLTATNGFSKSGYVDDVNDACAPAGVSFPTNDCSVCHTSNFGDSTPATTAYLAGGNALPSFFCPEPTPTCTDADGDGFTLEGGSDCPGGGAIDCDDTDPAIYPGATENCSDNIDNNCNGLIDDMDTASGCVVVVCTDADGDGFTLEGGSDCPGGGAIDCNDNDAAINPDAVDIPNNGIDEDCSGADSVDSTVLDTDGDSYSQADGDCNDNDPAINPGAFDIPNNGIDENCDGSDSTDTTTVDNDGDGFTPAEGDCDDTDGEINPDALEICGDNIDNDCNGLVDTQDSNGIDCPVTCIDMDGDGYAIDGGDCGPVDCNDSDATINPGASEVCEDSIDNDCDDSIDEGCDVTCLDADADGYQDATCGGDDCNDNDSAINPGSTEVCGNGTDENCNGASDDTCLTCPDGTLLVIKKMKYNRGDEKLKIKGRATAGTTITIINADTDEVLAEGIRVRKAKWEAEIEDVGRTLGNITVMTSNGCSVYQVVESDSDDEDEDDDDEDEDDDDEKNEDHDDKHKKSREKHRR